MFTSRKLKHKYLSPVHSRTTSQYFQPTVALTFVASFLDEWVINLNANCNSPLLLLTEIGKIKYTVLSILSFFSFFSLSTKFKVRQQTSNQRHDTGSSHCFCFRVANTRRYKVPTKGACHLWGPDLQILVN